MEPSAEQRPLTGRQAEVYGFVLAYFRLVGEGCPAQAVADRFKLHHETVREHFAILHRKGWLAAENSPARPYLSRR